MHCVTKFICDLDRRKPCTTFSSTTHCYGEMADQDDGDDEFIVMMSLALGNMLSSANSMFENLRNTSEMDVNELQKNRAKNRSTVRRFVKDVRKGGGRIRYDIDHTNDVRELLVAGPGRGCVYPGIAKQVYVRRFGRAFSSDQGHAISYYTLIRDNNDPQMFQSMTYLTIEQFDLLLPVVEKYLRLPHLTEETALDISASNVGASGPTNRILSAEELLFSSFTLSVVVLRVALGFVYSQTCTEFLPVLFQTIFRIVRWLYIWPFAVFMKLELNGLRLWSVHRWRDSSEGFPGRLVLLTACVLKSFDR